MHANSPDPERRLRIGYVSADFCQHAASYFIAPVLSGHDGREFDVVCYASVKCPDAVTKRLRRSVGTLRNVLGCTDERLAEIIVADAVDILVDLSGHTAGNRLGAFARKPAPLQLTCGGETLALVAPANGRSTAGLFVGSTSVGVLLGVDEFIIPGFTEEDLTQCTALLPSGETFTAWVLVTPRG